MSTGTAILNLVLASGVFVMVVAPLVWAILTQHRDHSRAAATDDAVTKTRVNLDRRRAPRRQYKSAIGGA